TSLFDPNAAVDMSHTRVSAADSSMGAPSAITQHRSEPKPDTPSTGVEVSSYQPVAFEPGREPLTAGGEQEPAIEAPAADAPAEASTDTAPRGLPSRRARAEANGAQQSGATAGQTPAVDPESHNVL